MRRSPHSSLFPAFPAGLDSLALLTLSRARYLVVRHSGGNLRPKRSPYWKDWKIDNYPPSPSPHTMPDNRRRRDKDAADRSHVSHVDMCNSFSVGLMNGDSKALMDKLRPPCMLRPEATREVIRKLVVLSGTDAAMNDACPYGDGDQSPVGLVGVRRHHNPSDVQAVMRGEAKRQVLRELFGLGGDLESHMIWGGGFTDFALMCCLGNARGVERALKQTEAGSDERMHLLERRETGCRLSPLLLTVALSKHKGICRRHHGVREEDMQHLKTVKVLLKYGARPDCRELNGKTFVHYGAGSHALNETLEMTSHVHEAAKSSKHFGRKVVLRGLNKAEYNGRIGVLGGFLADVGRRQVVLDDDGKELSLLPKNIFAVPDGEGEVEVCIYDESRNLANEHDRVGMTSFHEVFMSTRTDVAQWLIDRNVSVDVSPIDGMTVRKLAMSPDLGMMTGVGKSRMHELVTKYIANMEKAERRHRCHGCDQMFERKLMECSRCKSASYCSKECQVAHWKVHKHHCKKRDVNFSIVVDKPDTSIPSDLTSVKKLSFKRPKGLKDNETFYIKCQVATEADAMNFHAPIDAPTHPHVIYDRTRSVAFFMMPGTPGHKELFESVKKERAFEGKKAFFKAMYDSSGNMKVFPHTACAKKW